MEEKSYKFWDFIIKSLGFIATSASILIGLSQFSAKEKAAAELEFNRNFWQKQNELYANVCRSAGTMAAAIDDSVAFKKEKLNFLSLYYGEMILVEDSTVEKAMRELKSYTDVLVTADPYMVNTFTRKVLELSEACKKSSATFKRSNL
jgi:hypothetical protein